MTITLDDRFQSLFPGVRYPIVQAPMASTVTPELAAAVSNAGGIGSLGLGTSTGVQARQLIEQTRALTPQPFNVNVFCHEPAARDERLERAWLQHLEPLFIEFGGDAPLHLEEIYKSFVEDDEVFRMLLDARPAIVSFHFGLPTRDRLDALREVGITTLATATSLSEARIIEDSGVDVVVAQGIEAGGHRGIFDVGAVDQRLPTSVLVRTLVSEINAPVIAAGGIMDGQGIRAMLELGAVAAQLGTAFILCPESAANDGYRDVLKSDKASNTRLTPVLSGRPARGIVNRFVEHSESRDAPAPPAYPVAYDAAKQLFSVASSNEFAAHWAGQGAPLAREMPAESLVDALVNEMNGSGKTA